ncbi:oligosaccharide flippase family protein [Burkholderia catarinensis]|uniref:oligosaccharide flippase family protein n=1 Tax=Burkholderia catarinensis TaxID=1108140 RepID=UPI00092086BB|nr:oligosaccharide flippase family protein [Burkholderia catarinensis]KAG8150033.1 polysaccharide biosynthesis protein [Burkholderia catarinensis]
MLVRLLLRFATLAMKFALALVVARTLGFDAVGAYGLAVAASVIASKVLGLGFSPELNRRLSEADPSPALREARVLGAVYGALYLLLGALLAAATLSPPTADAFDVFGTFGLPPLLAWCVLLVALSEHAAFEANSWMFSLHRPRAGSLLLFVRTGAWAGIACAGLFTGVLRSIEAVFVLWFASNACVVVIAWRRIGALSRNARHARPPDRTPLLHGMFAVWRHGMPFYVAGVILATLQYAERFIAGAHLGADALGRYVFAWSIANAVQAVAFTTVVVTAGPRFVRTLADTPDAFPRQLMRAAVASAAVTILAAAAILVVHRDVFRLAHEPVGPNDVVLLAVLLLSFVLRSVADVLWTAAIALRTGIAALLSMAAVALLYLPFAWRLIADAGATGAAFVHLAASAGIAAALALVVTRGTATHTPRTNPEATSDAA